MKDESLLRREHTWGEPTSGWPRWGFHPGQKPRCWELCSYTWLLQNPVPVTTQPCALSLTYHLLASASGRGTRVLWSMLKATLHHLSLLLLALGQTPLLTLACLCCSGNPKGSRYPVLLVVPLHGNLSSGCWDSQMRKWNKLRGDGPWPPWPLDATPKEGRGSFLSPINHPCD